jgi:hypothetical protein
MNSAPSDYAPLVQGQLKWMATNACLELESGLPGGAGTNTQAIVAAFQNTNNWLAVNVGQLKAVAKPFHDRLIEQGFATNYPWTSTTADDVDYAVANIGQVKALFAFDVTLDSDEDGLPDAWETSSLGGLAWTGDDDPDADGHLNIYEYVHGSAPASASSIPAPTVVVTNGVTTIQAAIDSVTNDYDVILVSTGIYTGAGNRSLNFKGKKLALVSAAGPSFTTIDCQNYARGFIFTNGETRASVLSGFTVRNGRVNGTFFVPSAWGGGLLCSNSSPTILNCTITNNTVTSSSGYCFGGGIACLAGSAPLISGCSVMFNASDDYAGGIFADESSAPVVQDSVLAGNEGIFGGGAYSEGPSLFTNCLFMGNSAWWSGGAINCFAGRVVFCHVVANSVVSSWMWSEGGGVNAGGDAVIEQCIIRNNATVAYSEWYANEGGGVALSDGATLMDSIVLENEVSGWSWGRGGGVWLDAQGSMPTIENCVIASNSASDGVGGGVFVDGYTDSTNIPIAGCQIVENEALWYGGGIASYNASPDISRCTIMLNRSFQGAGLHFGTWSGPVEANAQPQVENTLLCGNVAEDTGGAIELEGAAAGVAVRNATLVGNSAASGGGLSAACSSNAALLNVIMWGNPGGEIVLSNSLLTVSHSCIQGGYASGTGIITNDPLLHLDGYHLLGTNSPCFNSGSTNAPAEDFDGDPRPSFGWPDIGADEFTDTDADGLPDWWETLHWGNATNAAAAGDDDGDSLSNVQEYQFNTDPNDTDTDGDGMSDVWEVEHGLDPLDATGDNGADGDPDGDGFANLQEFQMGGDPTDPALSATQLIHRLMHCRGDSSLRVDVEDSEDCGGTNPNQQEVEDIFNVGPLMDCGYLLSLTVEGRVEDQDSGFDKVSVRSYVSTNLQSDVPFFDGHNNGNGCAMADEQAATNVWFWSNGSVRLRYDTVDGLFHTDAYAEITAAAFVDVLKVDIVRPLGTATSTNNPYSVTPAESSWLSGSESYWDFQAVASGTTNSYSLDVEGEITPTDFNYAWTLEAGGGTLANTTSSTPTHSPPAAAGEDWLTLEATQGGIGTGCTSQRKLKVYEDHLARDYDNFGTSQSCLAGTWSTPFGSIEMDEAWNCHGSCQHATDNGAGPGTYGWASPTITFKSWPVMITYTNFPADWAAVATNLARGDVVTFFEKSNPGDGLHSHICLGSSSQMWGARNNPGDATKWGLCSSEAYYTGLGYTNHLIRVYKKP